jgi:hypothetical protein
MYTYDKSFMESIDGPSLTGGGAEDTENQLPAPAGLPFMHNLSVPLGLVLRKPNTGGGMPLIQSKCNGFMNEADYEKATSGTHIDKKNKDKKNDTRRKHNIVMKITRRKKR